MPTDLFRTLEDASGADLDWFWRGWLYTIDHVDVAIKDIRLLRMDTRDPKVDKAARKRDEDERPKMLTQHSSAIRE